MMEPTGFTSLGISANLFFERVMHNVALGFIIVMVVMLFFILYWYTKKRA